MLRIRNLRCGYGNLEVVHGASLHVERGEIVGLIGANGAGKTSLLNAIMGLLPPREGSIELDGVSIARQPVWHGVAHSLVLVPEGRQLFSAMTVADNLLMGGYRNPDRDQAIAQALDRFPRLRERWRQPAGTLSGGEQQMLAIARALVARPRLLLLDEPSMGLAPLMVKEVFEVIAELRRKGVTVFLVEQNAMAAFGVTDRVYVLETGDIVMEGRPDDLLHNPEVKRAYLGKGFRNVWE